ncbi:MAG: zinc-binding dehydrogenase, partial [Betaproteobacteria bacterium]|nr:zinc-binding dehydrogenase [Betaproteobacteria bacterium]
MAIVARRVTLEQDGIPGYMAHPEGPETRAGIMMVHHAHGVTADYKIDAYRLAQLGYNVLAPDFFNMFGVPGSNHIGAGADLQAKHGDTEFLVKMDEAWQFLIELGHNEPNPFQPEAHRPVLLNGKTVLVNGAAGGVGHFAVQLAKWKGARVIAVASGAHEAFLRELDADQFIDYTKNSSEDVAHDVDLVLDTLGGPTTGRFLRTLKRGGALFPVFLGFSDAEEAAKLGITVSMTQVRSNGSQLAELGRLLDAGTVRVAVDST